MRKEDNYYSLGKGGDTLETLQKYTIIKKIGEGGAGTVLLAEQKNIQRMCAIKVINKELLGYSQVKNEYMLLKQIEHSSVPRIYDVEEDDERLYIIEEYINGETLGSYIGKNHVGEFQVVEMIRQLCNIFEYLHTELCDPIVYQDLKPENILITANQQIKLVDFGSAIMQNESGMEQGKWVTPEYAAPEVLTKHRIDYRADIYSIGKLVEYILRNNKIKLTHSNILLTVMKGCLAKEPRKRFGSIYSIIKILNQGISELSKERNKTICVLGSQGRIGTTHCSLVIGKILERKGYSVMVKESNPSSCFDQLLERNKIKGGKQGIYQLGGLEFLPTSNEGRTSIQKQYTIQDCGDMPEELPSGDYYILIVGTREWELAHTERAIRRFIHMENLLIICNLSNKKVLFSMEKALKGKRFLSMPYIEIPFCVSKGIREKLLKVLSIC